MSVKKYLSEVCVPVYILVALFAMSSWIDMYGVYVELPMMVATLPEGWRLPSFLVIIVQIANFGPLVYLLVKKLTKTPGKIKEWYFVYVIIGVGCMASFLLAFLWDSTSVINGQERSTGLLVLTAFLALVDCTASVVFLPYMAKFKEQYMSAYFSGESLGGLVAAMVAFIQGSESAPDCINVTVSEGNVTSHTYVPVYQPPVFSVQVFFFFIFGVLCVSGVSFTLLQFCPYCKKGMINPYPHTETKNQGEASERAMDVFTVEEHDKPDRFASKDAKRSSETLNNSQTDGTEAPQSIPRWQFAFALAVVGWSSFVAYGFIPSTQAYSTLPFGNQAYSLTVRITTAVNPLACFLALFARTRSMILLGSLTGVATLLSIFQVYLAAVSPYPPLKGTSVGVGIVVASTVIMNAFLAYSRVVASLIVRSSGGRNALLWCGMAIQGSAAVGAVAIFLVVNVFQLFESEPACP